MGRGDGVAAGGGCCAGESCPAANDDDDHDDGSGEGLVTARRSGVDGQDGREE